MAGVLAIAPLSVAVAQKLEDVDLAAERAGIGQFQDADQRLQSVGWKLARANSAFCNKTTASIGLRLQDTASYGRPDIAQAALGLEGAFAVQAAAAGSPAALSGAFVRNREVTRLGAQDPNSWRGGKRQYWDRLTQVHDWIDDQLASKGSVTVTFADGEAVTIEPVTVCATRFKLLGASKQALADGSNVFLGVRFPGFAWDEDAVFAGVVAHELAHNLLGHTAWLDRNKRKRKHVRLTEREADRLMPWLMANAGYDPQAAHDFMTRWGKNHNAGLFLMRSHEGWDERAEHIAAEIPIVREWMRREGKADWSKHFRREIDPDKGLEIAQKH